MPYAPPPRGLNTLLAKSLFQPLQEWATRMCAVPVEVEPEALILIGQMAINQVAVEFVPQQVEYRLGGVGVYAAKVYLGVDMALPFAMSQH